MFVDCLNPKPFKLAAEVDYLSSFKINWQASFNNTNKWHNMNSTSNELYLTFKDGGSEAFETVLHIGCKNAKGQTKEAAVVSAIWSEFTDCKVNTKAGERLYYYKDGTVLNKYSNPIYSTVTGLLKTKNGKCEAWVLFLKRIIEKQGIGNVTSLNVTSNEPHKYYLLIKKWKFVQVNSNDSYGYYLSTKSMPTVNVAIPQDGIRGQGPSLDPQSFFKNHAVIQYKQKIYDPSYGKEYTSLEAFKEKFKTDCLNAFYYEITQPNGNVLKFAIPIETSPCYIKTNPSANQN